MVAVVLIHSYQHTDMNIMHTFYSKISEYFESARTAKTLKLNSVAEIGIINTNMQKHPYGT